MNDRIYTVILTGKDKCLATRELFTYEQAERYLKAIHPDHAPRIIPVAEMIRMLPPCVELKDTIRL
jgi:hypothetical protein